MYLRIYMHICVPPCATGRVCTNQHTSLHHIASPPSSAPIIQNENGRHRPHRRNRNRRLTTDCFVVMSRVAFLCRPMCVIRNVDEEGRSFSEWLDDYADFALLRLQSFSPELSELAAVHAETSHEEASRSLDKVT